MQLVEDEFERIGLIVNFEFDTSIAPDLLVIFYAQWRKLDFVSDSTQECLVRKIQWMYIGREDHYNVERHREMPARLQGKKVFFLLQWYDPSIEQRHGIDPLSSQVIDDEDAVVSLELKRCLVQFRRRLIHYLQHVRIKFAARNHCRSFTKLVARIVPVVQLIVITPCFQFDHFVYQRVEHLHNVLADRDSVWNEGWIGEQSRQTLRNESLARTCRSVKEYRSTGVQ